MLKPTIPLLLVGALLTTAFSHAQPNDAPNNFVPSVTVNGGVQFQYLGGNDDGSDQWRSSDGHYFPHVTLAEALSYGLSAEDAKRYYAIAAAPQPEYGHGEEGGRVVSAPPTATTANGAQFQFGGANLDGTANWTRADGQVFKNVTRADAVKYGISAADAERFYGPAPVPAPAALAPASGSAAEPATKAAPAPAPVAQSGGSTTDHIVFVPGPCANPSECRPSPDANYTVAQLKPGERLTPPNDHGISWVIDEKGNFQYMVSEKPADGPKMIGGLEKTVLIAPPRVFIADVTLANGSQFQFSGDLGTGAMNWVRSDGQVFIGVDRDQARKFGMSKADLARYYDRYYTR
jgi:hypothetical protein